MRIQRQVVGLTLAAGTWLISPLARAGTIETVDARARTAETTAFANGLLTDPTNISEGDDSSENATDGASAVAKGGKNAHIKVPHSLHSSEWKHAGTGGKIDGRKAARYAKDPKKKRHAEVALTKELNKRGGKKFRKNADGSYKHQVRLDDGGNMHLFNKR